MRIILSRKGFDSANGRVASPIFPSGEMCSLPIPQPDPSRLTAPIHYRQIAYNGQSLASIVSDLTRRRVAPEKAAHLDPDLDAQSLPRQTGWRPVFGQNGAAETHLRNQGVQAGDVFLFFGWFKRVEEVSGRYRFVSGTPDLHVIFGWLQIKRRIPLLSRSQVPPWALYHPHCQVIHPDSSETLYMSTPDLELPGISAVIPGGGVFGRFRADLQLTAAGEGRSKWRLPGWFHPRERRSALSYHTDWDRWEPVGLDVWLRTVGRGQEFVLDCDHYPEAIQWLAQLLNASSPLD